MSPPRELPRSAIALPITPRPIHVQPIEDAVRRNVEATVKRQLGLNAIPADLQEIVSTAAKTAASTSVELSVARAAEEAARGVGRANLRVRFDEKIKVAADSLTHISQSNDVDQVLKRRSDLLAKKRASLVAAGFTNDEAMQIVLADIAARAH